MYPPDLDVRPGPVPVPENIPITEPNVEAPITEQDPIGDLLRFGKSFGKGALDLGLGLGTLATTPPANIATQIGYDVAGRYATGGAEEGAMGLAESVSPIPFDPVRKMMSGNPEQFSEGMGEALPYALAGIAGLKTGKSYLENRTIKDVTPRAKAGQARITGPEDFDGLRRPEPPPEILIDDPNYNQGKGDAELAGSIPYKAQTELVKLPTDIDIRPGPVSVRPRFGGNTRASKQQIETVNTETGEILTDEHAEFDPDMPQFAKVGDKKAQISVNVQRAADELTKGYNNPLEAVMVREGLQNAFDIVKPLGAQGKVTIKVADDGLEIGDNGKGMTPDELFTVYTNLHESGKITQENATGGKGVGKAPYMLGGKDFEVRTVTKIGNKVIESSFRGTPEELMQPFDIETNEVSPATPTGTWFRTNFKPGQEGYQARDMLRNIFEYSRGLTHLTDIDSGYITEPGKPIKPFSDDRLIAEELLDEKSNNIQVYLPKDVDLGERSIIQIHYLNNGMYQFREHFYLDEKVNGIPNKIIVNIEPKVAEGTDKYPFPVQRESIKDNLLGEIHKLIKNELINPFKNRRTHDLKKLWDSMEILDSGIQGNIVFFDPGNRLLPEEATLFKESQTLNYLAYTIDNIIGEILQSSGNQKWVDRVRRTGITLDPNMHGVHIPLPGSEGKVSAILMNPFIRMETDSPANAALETIVTALHEVAHVGIEKGSYVPLEAEDIDDPRVGRFLQTYLKETISQGGLDMGHGMPFIHRLGEIYGRFGTRKALDAATQLEKSISAKGQPGRYSPEIQGLLQIYSSSRGRDAVTEDILSGTGIKQAAGGGGKENIPSNVARLAGGTSGGGGKPPTRSLNTGKPRPEPSNLREAWNVTRGLLSIDLPFITSAALRQAKGHIGTRAWFKAWYHAAKVYGSDAAYKAHLELLKQNEIFRPSIPSLVGRPKSPAEVMGLRFVDLGSFTGREEAIRSQWAEKVPLIGRAAKASNRSYAAFLNDIRTNAAQIFYDEAAAQGKFPNKNFPLLKQIGQYVNNSTGSGELATRIPGRPREFSLEKYAEPLAEILFSPRLIASNLQTLNPYNYVMTTDPLVRMEYWKSLARIAGAWLAFAGLAKIMGAKVSLDPTNSDFGKIKIGNTRIDIAGGLQQFLVLAARQGKGEYTSSTSGKTTEMGSSYVAETRGSTLERFAANKIHPSASFIYDLAYAAKKRPVALGDKILQTVTPMIIQDLTQLVQEDPKMLLFAPLISAGYGTQTYDRNMKDGVYIDKKNDYLIEGGSPLR